MGVFDALFTAANSSIDSKVTNKTETDSISPVDAGSAIKDSTSAALTATNLLAGATFLTGDTPPTNGIGNDLDYYLKGGTSITIYKKVSGVWINLGSTPLGITIVDGNISVWTIVTGDTIRSYAGQWALDNVIYQKATQTEFTIDVADPILDRIDAVFGNTSNNVTYLAGTPMSTPTPPTTPANSVVLSYVYVPSIASGLSPYISDDSGQGQSNGGMTLNQLSGDVNLVEGANITFDIDPVTKEIVINSSGGGGITSVSFEDITGNPEDNPALDGVYAKKVGVDDIIINGTNKRFQADLTVARKTIQLRRLDNGLILLQIYERNSDGKVHFTVVNAAQSTFLTAFDIDSVTAVVDFKNNPTINGVPIGGGGGGGTWGSITGTLSNQTDLQNALNAKLTGTLASDAELQTQTTPTEDNKFVSRHGLIYYWNWLKTQAVQFTSLGAGVLGNIATHLNIGANTTAKSQARLTQSTTDVTSPANGDIWNNSGELKFMENSIVNRLLKVYGNELFVSDGLYFSTFNQYGDMSANIKAVEAWVYNTDVIDAINGATFDEEGVATITPTTGELKQGQYYYNETDKILYFGLDDNIVTILTPNILVDSTGVKWRTVVSTSGVLSTTAI